MSEKDRLALVLEFLEQYHQLARKGTDEVEWIALKFSTSREQASRLIVQALKQQAKGKAKAGAK